MSDLRGIGAGELWTVSRPVAQVRERQAPALYLRHLFLTSGAIPMTERGSQ